MPMYIDSQIVEGLLTHKSWNTNVLTTTVASGTLLLTAASESTQVFTGTVSGQILRLPDCTTLTQIGQRYTLHNDSSQNVTVNDNASGLLFLLGAAQRAFLICTSIGSAAGTWSWFLVDRNATAINQLFVTYPGTGLSVNYTGGIARINGTPTTIAAGTIALTASTSGFVYVDIDGIVKQTASLPNGAMAMASFTTGVSTVTALADVREIVDDNTVWGVVGDIVSQTYNRAASAGVLEKYARADHAHAQNDLLSKAGVVTSGTFAGNPKKATITFGTAMPSATYSIVITGQDARSWTYETRTTGGFVINANANQALTADVSWKAVITGEST